jgi:hypothetical protein
MYDQRAAIISNARVAVLAIAQTWTPPYTSGPIFVFDDFWSPWLRHAHYPELKKKGLI